VTAITDLRDGWAFPDLSRRLARWVEWLDSAAKKPAKLRIRPKCEEAGITAGAVAANYLARFYMLASQYSYHV